MLTKSNPATGLTVGVPSDYQLTVTNSGSTASANNYFFISERLPPNVQFNSASFPGGGCTLDPTNPGTLATGQLYSCFIRRTAGNLPAGGSITGLLNVTPLAAAANQSVTNRARLEMTGAADPALSTYMPDGCTGNDLPSKGCAVSPAMTVKPAPPVLGLSKANPATLTVGVTSAYTLTLSNTGSGVSGTSLDVYDKLPAQVAFSSAAPAGGGTVTPSAVACAVQSGDVASGQLLKCTLTLPAGGLPASTGTANFNVSVTPTAAASGQSVSNKAAVDSSGGNAVQDPATCTGSNAPTAGCTTSPPQTVGHGVNLNLAKTNPASLTVGVAGNYTLSLSNTGTGPSGTSVDVYEQLPAGIGFNSAATATGGTIAASGVSCMVQSGDVATGQLLKCTVTLPSGGLLAGGSTNFTVNVTPTAAAAGSSVSNKAAVDSSGGNAAQTPANCTGNNSPTSGCTVSPSQTVQGTVTLALSKTSPAGGNVGGVSTYALKLSNTGNIASGSSIVVYDDLPQNLEFYDIQPNASGSVQAAASSCAVSGNAATGQSLICSITVPGGIPAAGSVGFDIRVLARAGGMTGSNKAAVDPSGNNATQTPGACSATDSPAGCAVAPGFSVSSVGPVVSLFKAPSPSATSLKAGVASTYRIVIDNSPTNSTAPAQGHFVFSDQLPPGFDWLGVSAVSRGSPSFNPTSPSTTITPNAVSCVPSGSVATGLFLTCTVDLPSLLVVGASAAVDIQVRPRNSAIAYSATNKARIDATGFNAPQSSGAVAACSATGSPVGCAVSTNTVSAGSGAFLELSKADPASLTVGTGSAYTITVTNKGVDPSGTTVLELFDKLPANVAFVSAAPATGGTAMANSATCAVQSGSTVATGELLKCTLLLNTGGIAANGSVNFVINVMPNASVNTSQPLFNKAAVDATGGNAAADPSVCTAVNTPNPGCAVSPGKQVGTGVVLGLSKANPATLAVGVTSAYTLTLSNTGAGASGTSLDVYDKLPAHVAFSSAAPAGGGTVTPSAVACAVQSGDVASGQLLKCTLTLPAGGLPASTGTANFNVSVTPTAAASGSSVSNKAAVDSSGGNAVQDPATCTGSNAPTAGCTTSPPQTVGHGITLALSKISQSGVGSFSFSGSNGWGTQTLVTSAPGTPVEGAPQGLSQAGQATRITEALPSGWALSQVSCLDKTSSTSGNPGSVINPVISAGGIFELPASVVRPGATLVCSVINTFGGNSLSGQVILDNGLGSGGVAHDGVQNGTEQGHAGVMLKLTDCANQVYSSTNTDGNGQFTLSTSAAPAGSTVCLVETLPTGYVAVSRQLGNTAGSYNAATQTLSFTLAANTSYSGVLLGEVASSLLTGEGAQQVVSGQSVLYAHTYTAGTSASVLFSTADQSGTSTDKWSSLVYADANCNGKLDAGESPLTQALNVQVGQQLCLLVKVNSPAGQASGTRDQTTLQAQETYQPTPGLGATVKTYSRVDVSTVGTGGGGTLSLLKQVRLVSSCPSTVADTQPFVTSNQAQPGQFVEYQLVYSNRSTGPLTAIRISDAVPAYTSFRSGGCGPVPGGLQSCALTQQPASGGSGSLQWDLQDASAASAQSGLQPGASGWVQFCVQIQQ